MKRKRRERIQQFIVGKNCKTAWWRDDDERDNTSCMRTARRIGWTRTSSESSRLCKPARVFTQPLLAFYMIRRSAAILPRSKSSVEQPLQSRRCLQYVLSRHTFTRCPFSQPGLRTRARRVSAIVDSPSLSHVFLCSRFLFPSSLPDRLDAACVLSASIAVYAAYVTHCLFLDNSAQVRYLFQTGGILASSVATRSYFHFPLFFRLFV